MPLVFSKDPGSRLTAVFRSTLAAPLVAGATSIQLEAGDGDLLPALGSGDELCLLVGSDNGGIEVICTGRSGDALACETVRPDLPLGTVLWPYGTLVAAALTPYMLRAFVQHDELTTLLTWDGDQIAINGSVTGPHLTGPAGTNGTNGTNGADGTDGKTVRNGSGAPSSGLGADGDFYIDTSANLLYGPKAGAWGGGVSLVGPTGVGMGTFVVFDGTTSPPTIKASNNVVSVSRNGSGDYTINFINPMPNLNYGAVVSCSFLTGVTGGTFGQLYGDGPTSTSSLRVTTHRTTDVGIDAKTVTVALTDAQTGVPGAQGIQGVPGADGKTLLNGAGAPSSIGSDGDFYVDTTNWQIYGPKSAGAWGGGTNLIGASGAGISDGSVVNLGNAAAIYDAGGSTHYPIGYRQSPQNAQTGSYTITLADDGKHICLTGTSQATFTIPSNASVAYAAGTRVMLTNNSTAMMLIAAVGGVTLTIAGTGYSGNAALVPGGVATLLKVGTDTWLAYGKDAGLIANVLDASIFHVNPVVQLAAEADNTVLSSFSNTGSGGSTYNATVSAGSPKKQTLNGRPVIQLYGSEYATIGATLNATTTGSLLLVAQPTATRLVGLGGDNAAQNCFFGFGADASSTLFRNTADGGLSSLTLPYTSGLSVLCVVRRGSGSLQTEIYGIHGFVSYTTLSGTFSFREMFARVFTGGSQQYSTGYYSTVAFDTSDWTDFKIASALAHAKALNGL